MKTSSQKSPIDAEAFMKFFEEHVGVKFVDAQTGQSALSVFAQNKRNQKSDYDLWLEEQDEETRAAHRMGEF